MSKKSAVTSGRRHRQSRRRRALAALGTLILGASIGIAGVTPASATVAQGPCEFMTIIGVRGTDAVGGVGTGIHSGRVWAPGAGGAGPIISNFMGKFVDVPYPVYQVALRYPASGGSNYASSVQTGRDTLVNELNWIASTCAPQLPAVVLAGHSQGADVILEAITNKTSGPNLSAGARQMISAVPIFGDPTFQANQPYNAPGSPVGRGIFGRIQGSTATLAAFRNQWNEPKIRSYCKSGDAICQSGLGPDAMTIHNSYATDTPAAKSWVDYMTTDFG